MLNNEDAVSSKVALQPLQPTIFIALGGTGMKILLRIRRRILMNRWNGERLGAIADFPLAQFLYFDVDTQDAREENKSGSADLLGSVVAFTPNETLQTPLDVTRFLGNRATQPLIDEWFPNDDVIRTMDFSDGAAQVRCVSRLHFFLQSSAFRERFDDKVNAIKNSLGHTETLKRLGLSIGSKGYRVVILASAAGGTGSGSFLDAGFFIRSLGDPALNSVSLVLLLAGAYSSANAQRVQANTVAALRELEYCMDRSHQPRYVTRWQQNRNSVPADIAPYNDVYLIDNINIERESTNDPSDLYDMIASTLFADFGSSDFAQHKRSVASNMAQFKMLPYFPPLPDGGSSLRFSRGFSSFGQAVAEAQAWRDFDRKTFEIAEGLLTGYYGMAEQRESNAVSDADLRDVLEKRLHLHASGRKFLDDPEVGKYFSKVPPNLVPSVTILKIVDDLLTGGEESLLRGVDGRLEREIARIRQGADITLWPEQIGETVRAIDLEIAGVKGSQEQSPRAKEIDVAARRIWEVWIGEGEGGFADFIYRLVEDAEKGGVHYALDMMRQVRRRLIDQRTGAVDVLNQTAQEYDRWAEMLRNALEDRPLANIKALKGARSIELGETILLQNVKPLLSRYGHYRLIALACRMAAGRLKRFAEEFLGRPEQRGEETIWNGLIGQIDNGRQRLAGLSREIKNEIKLIDQHKDTRTHWYVGGSSPTIAVSVESLSGLARQVFQDQFHGSKALFQTLGSNSGKLQVREALRNAVQDALASVRSQLPSITDVLQANRDLAAETLKQLMRRAAPWVNAEVDRMDGFTNDQLKLYIAVNDVKRFTESFGPMVRSAAPGRMSPAIIESGVPEKIMCYCEVSGLPLTTLVPLRTNWRDSFRLELETGRKLPLFNHKERLRFRSPIVPDAVEYARRRDNVIAFEKAVAFGILIRGSDRGETGEHADNHFLEVQPGIWLGKGNERSIFADEGSEPTETLRPLTDEVEAGLSGVDWAGLYVLFQYYAHAVYPPKTVTMEGGGQRIDPGFAGATCAAIARDYEERFLRSGSDRNEAKERFATLTARLEAGLRLWTVPVTESRRDPDPNDCRSRDADDKRVVIWEKLRAVASGAIAVQVPTSPSKVGPQPAPVAVAPAPAPAQAPAAAPTVVAPPPPAAAGQPVWYVAGPDNQRLGPLPYDDLPGLVRSGVLTASGLAWRKGMPTWRPAGELNELAELFIIPDDEPPPLPPQDSDEPPPLP